jgi:hypothetical protein
VDPRRTRLAAGAATLLSSHAGHPWTGDERHSERWSDPNGADSLKESQLAAGPGTISTASDITDTADHNSKPDRSSRGLVDPEYSYPCNSAAGDAERQSAPSRRYVFGGLGVDACH